MDGVPLEIKIIFLEILPILIILFGLIGNVISFTIYSTKELEKLSVSIYYRVLAISDSINLLIYLPLLIKFVFQSDFQILNDSTCKLFIYFSFTMPSMSVFFLLLLSLDRAMCVLYPNHKMFREKKTQIISILVISLYNMIVYVPISLAYSKVEDLNYTVCACRREILCIIIRWVDVFNSLILPFIIMISCSLIVAIQVKKSKNRIQTHQFNRKNSNCIKSSNAFLHSKNVQIAFISFGLNFIFLACNLPITIYQMQHFDYYDNGELRNALFYSIAEVIYYAHFSLSFFVHVLFNCKFRSELNRLIINKLLFKRKEESISSPNLNVDDTLNNSKRNSYF